MVAFKLGWAYIRRDAPPFIIADACYNHLGNMDMAFRMIEQAAKAGADCIKFQHIIADDCMLPSTPLSVGNKSLFEYMKEIAFTIDEHKALMEHCNRHDILYLCTPFGYKAVDELASLGVDVVKVGSGEVMDFGFLEHIASHKLKMIVSTGMCTWEDITNIYNFLTDIKADFSMLHCISEYPPQYNHVNLNMIPEMIRKFCDRVIGFSDHTPDNYTSFAAVALGASIIEKHFILSKNVPGPDANVSIDVDGLKDLVYGARKVHSAMMPVDKIRNVSSEEKRISEWARRSVVSMVDIIKGTLIREDMLATRRPGTGIPANMMKDVVGRRAKHNISMNELITWDDIEEGS
jgi:N-acetylneuraminate synthase